MGKGGAPKQPSSGGYPASVDKIPSTASRFPKTMNKQRTITAILAIAVILLGGFLLNSEWQKQQDRITQEREDERVAAEEKGYTEGVAIGRTQAINVILNSLNLFGKYQIDWTYTRPDGSTSSEHTIIVPAP